MQNAAPAGQCTSGPNNTCQFVGYLHPREFEGHYYCEAHAPFKAPFRFTFDQLNNFIGQQLPKIDPHNFDLTGVVFAAHAHARYVVNNANVTACNCTFADEARFQISACFDMSGSKCRGNFHVHNAWEIHAREVHFAGDANFDCNNAMQIDFSASVFDAQVNLLQLKQNAALRFDDVTLAYPPEILLNSPRLPQNSSFKRLTLRKTAYNRDAEAKYRQMGIWLHENRDREQEGAFYQYEKRTQRKNSSLTHLDSWIPRFISTCYDWLVGYGQSYERALLWFVAVQIAFAFLYSIKSGRFEFGRAVDSQVVAFTLAQTVKPFELLSSRVASGWPYAGIYTGNEGGWWLASTMTDTVLSLSLVALFLLALRWRFRRD